MVLAWVVMLACLFVQAGVSDASLVYPLFLLRLASYVALGIFLLAVLGTVATCGYPKQDKALAVYCVLFTTFLSLFLFCLMYTFVYAAGLDTNSSLFYSWEFMVEMMQHASVEFAQVAPVEWFKLQQMFECCGVSMRKTYLYPSYGKPLGTFLDSQLSGELCARGRLDIEALHLQFAVFEPELETRVANTLGAGFFCFQRMRILFNFYSGSFGVVVTMLFLFLGTLFLLVAACILWCRAPPTRQRRTRSVDFSTISTRPETNRNRDNSMSDSASQTASEA